MILLNCEFGTSLMICHFTGKEPHHLLRSQNSIVFLNSTGPTISATPQNLPLPFTYSESPNHVAMSRCELLGQKPVSQNEANTRRDLTNLPRSREISDTYGHRSASPVFVAECLEKQHSVCDSHWACLPIHHARCFYTHSPH